MLLILCIGSIYASDPVDNQDNDDFSSDWKIEDLDDYYDQFGKWHDHSWDDFDWGDNDLDEDSDDSDLDDDSDWGDDDLDDSDLDDGDDFDDWDDSEFDDGDDFDDYLCILRDQSIFAVYFGTFGCSDDPCYNSSGIGCNVYQNYSFDTLKSDILITLERFGNSSDANWTESDEFNRIYQSYLKDNASYGLDESNENYDTYLKIYNAFVSALEHYNLTDNETAYLKCLIMYYLNNYGNCTNSTWYEYISFCKSFLATCCMDMLGQFSASASAPGIGEDGSDRDYGNDAVKYMNLNLND